MTTQNNDRPDATLVTETLAGNRRAFGILVHRYSGDVFALAYAYTGNRHDAEDVMQDTFLTALRKLNALRNREKFLPWLMQATRNRAIQGTRRRATEQRILAAQQMDTSTNPTPNESEEIVWNAMEKLRPREREILTLYYFTGVKISELALRLDITPEAAKKRLQRARESMRVELEGNFRDACAHIRPRSKKVEATVAAALAANITWQGTAYAATAPSLLSTGPVVKAVAACAIVGAVAVGIATSTTNTKVTQEPTAPATESAAAVAQSTPPAPTPPAVAAPASSQQGETTEPTAEEPAAPYTLFGKITDRQGNAIPDAKIILYHKTNTWGLDDSEVAQAQSSDLGHYGMPTPLTFTSPNTTDPRPTSYLIYAEHPDYAFGWRWARIDDPTREYDIVLTQPTSRTIRVTSDEGEPIEGALVAPNNVGSKELSDPLFQDHIHVNGILEFAGTYTDASGKARFKNLPDARMGFKAIAKGYAAGNAFSDNRSIRLSKAATVSGRVVDDRGMPAAHTQLKFDADWMSLAFRTLTDASGKFTLDSLPANGWNMSAWSPGQRGNGNYTVTILSDELIAKTKLELEPDTVTNDLTISAIRGATIRCTVIGVGTNERIAGARVVGYSDAKLFNGTTDENGQVTFAARIGQARFSVESPPPGVHFGVDQNDEDINTFCEITDLKPMDIIVYMPEIRGKLVTLEGAVEGPPEMSDQQVTVYSDAGYYKRAGGTGLTAGDLRVDNQGHFTLREAPTNRRIHLFAQTDDGSFAGAAYYDIPPDDQNPPTLRIALVKTVDASILIADDQGNPIPNTPTQVTPHIGGEPVTNARRNFDTDERGFLNVPGVVPGLTYRLAQQRPNSGPIPGNMVIGGPTSPLDEVLVLAQ